MSERAIMLASEFGSGGMSELLCKWCFGMAESVSEWMVYGRGGDRVSPGVS